MPIRSHLGKDQMLLCCMQHMMKKKDWDESLEAEESLDFSAIMPDSDVEKDLNATDCNLGCQGITERTNKRKQLHI